MLKFSKEFNKYALLISLIFVLFSGVYCHNCHTYTRILLWKFSQHFKLLMHPFCVTLELQILIFYFSNNLGDLKLLVVHDVNFNNTNLLRVEILNF